MPTPFSIVISRPSADLEPFKPHLKCFPAIQIHGIPLIEITYKKVSPPKMDAPINWLFFTSQHGVHAFFKQADPSITALLSSTAIAVVGPKTAQALEQYGHSAQFTPTTFSAHQAAQEWIAQQTLQQHGSQHIMWPCSTLAQDTLPFLVNQAGHQITRWPVYATQPRSELHPEEIITLHQAHWIGLTSPSCVTALHQTGLLNSVHPQGGWLVIGPSTQQALNQGLKHLPSQTINMAQPHTLDGMGILCKRLLAQWVTQSVL